MVGPAAEEVGEEGGGRVRGGVGPVEDLRAEEGEGVNEVDEGGEGGGEVFGVLDVGGEGGVVWEIEEEGADGGGGGEEWGEEGEVEGGDGDGDGEVEAVGEEVGEVEEGEEVALGWKGDDQDVGPTLLQLIVVVGHGEKLKLIERENRETDD